MKFKTQAQAICYLNLTFNVCHYLDPKDDPRPFLDELGIVAFEHLAMIVDPKFLIKMAKCGYYKGQMDLMKNFATMSRD